MYFWDLRNSNLNILLCDILFFIFGYLNFGFSLCCLQLRIILEISLGKVFSTKLHSHRLHANNSWDLQNNNFNIFLCNVRSLFTVIFYFLYVPSCFRNVFKLIPSIKRSHPLHENNSWDLRDNSFNIILSHVTATSSSVISTELANSSVTMKERGNATARPRRTKANGARKTN